MTLGEKIKQARKKKGLSQKKLGELLGVSGAMIGQYETGQRNPKKETIKKIANALDVPAWELQGDSRIDIDINEKMSAHELNATLEKLKKASSAFGIIQESQKDFIASLAGITASSVERLQKDSVALNLNTLFNLTDMLPAEFNEFSLYIGKMGYHVTLEDEQYYLVKGNKRKAISVIELKTLVRTSQTVITGLLDSLMEE